MAGNPQEQSLGQLIAQLSNETATLVRKEVELATTELTAKAEKAATNIGVAAAGGALVHAGVLVLLAAVVVGLNQLGVQAWLSAAIVAFATICIGLVLVRKGVTALRRTSVTPRQALEAMKEA